MKTIITPAMAESILQGNVGNRKISQARVDDLVVDMAAGNWVHNGQTIVLNTSGKLLDGQHRLTACIQSGASFTTEIIYGIEDERAFVTIDTGKTRGATDILFIEHGASNPRMASALKALHEIFCYEGDYKDFLMVRRKVTNQQMSEAFHRYDGLEELCEQCGKKRMQAVVVAGFWILKQADEHNANKFIDKISAGLFDSPDCPAKRLHDAIFISGGARGTNGVTRTLAIVFKAYNHFLAGKKMKILRFVIERDSFPLPVGFENIDSKYFLTK